MGDGGGASTGTAVRAVNSSRPRRGPARVSTPQVKEGHRGAQGGACTDLSKSQGRREGGGFLTETLTSRAAQ